MQEHNLRKASVSPWLIAGRVIFTFGLIACIAAYVLMQRTTFGFGARMVGGNVRAARMAGLSVTTLSMITCFLAGAAAGPQRHRGDGATAPFKSPVPLKIPCRLGAPLHLGASCAQPSGADAPIRKVVQDFCKIPAREIEKAAPKGGFFSLLDNIGGIFRFSNT